MDTWVIPIDVRVEREQHDRETFQREGHFVPGNCTGPQVHALTLKTPEGLQILRTLAPTHEEAVELMRAAIREHINSTAKAQAQEKYTYEEYLGLIAAQAQLSMFIENNYAYERATDNHGQFLNPITTAMYYLRVERKRWRIRLRNWFIRKRTPEGIPSDSNQWLPPEVRKD